MDARAFVRSRYGARYGSRYGARYGARGGAGEKYQKGCSIGFAMLGNSGSDSGTDSGSDCGQQSVPKRRILVSLLRSFEEGNVGDLQILGSSGCLCIWKGLGTSGILPALIPNTFGPFIVRVTFAGS